MKRFLLLIASLLLYILSFPQTSSTSQQADSTEPKTLQEVIVKAYEQNRKLAEVPASIGLVGQSQLNRFNNMNILPAVNTIPGVHMEERSPASYRLNIRGSSLRSPFGVRDVKIYYNEIPLTAPDGNTYLNQLSFYNFQTIEIIKGPASSLYGAGIGGAMLIRSMPPVWQKGFDINYLGGSYATNNINGDVRWGDADHQNDFSYTHQSSNGYRVQTQMRRDIASWETLVKASDKQSLHAYILYSDLYYQTPGGLTKAQYDSAPTQARPPAGPTPGAVQNKAAVFQKIFTVGFANEYHFSENWQNTTSAYGAYTDFQNPGIRVYEIRKEPQFGGRTVFQYKKPFSTGDFQLNFGAEAQKGFYNTQDYANNKGVTDTLQTNDDINNWQYMIFGQADLKLRSGWIFTVGASFNKSSVYFNRLSVVPPVSQTRTFDNKIAPRFAILKKIARDVSLYASAAKGFSTPTVSELMHSNELSYNLQPEDGIDYEGGIRGSLWHDKFYFDIDAFFFHLRNTIVERIDTNAVFYYVNAGATQQDGIEAYLSYQLVDHPLQFISNVKTWIGYTWNDFHYKDFKQVSTDYSGNRMPGVARQTVVAGLDIASRHGVYLSMTYTYTDPIILNDANTDFANSYNLLGARAGYKKLFIRKIRLEIFAGVDNIFNVKYSLGNDINAAAGRYYNAAPGINFYAGISFGDLFH